MFTILALMISKHQRSSEILDALAHSGFPFTLPTLDPNGPVTDPITEGVTGNI